MNDGDFEKLARAVRDLIRPQLKRSTEARRAALLLGKWLLHEAGEAETETEAEAEAESGSESIRLGDTLFRSEHPIVVGSLTPNSAGAGPDGAVAESSRGIVPLKIGDAEAHIPVPGTTEDIGRARQSAGASSYGASPAGDSGASAVEIDLALVENRCRLKSDSCRLYIRRRAAVGDQQREPELVGRIDEMIAEARALPDCFLWVFWRERTQPDDASLGVIATCYDALAACAALVRRIDALGEKAGGDALVSAMQLLAEADSALRIALEMTWLTAPDSDQEAVHLWLRRETSLRKVFIPRHMRLDDPGDPYRAGDVIAEAAQLGADVEARAGAMAEINEIFKQIGYHARKIERSADDPDPHDSRKIIAAIEALDLAGVPASDLRYAEMISPAAVRRISPDDSSRAEEVFERIRARRESAASDVDAAREERTWSERVHEVRSMIEGRQIVVVGGEPRPDAAQRMEEAFGLSKVEWVRLTEHGTGDPMRAPIARPETALVLVLVKLVGHQHAEDANDCAAAEDKPCVYLRAGYNPEQIAVAVLRQASERLRHQAAH